MRRLRTAGEAAIELDMSVKKVYALIHSGALRAEDHSIPGSPRKTWKIDISEIVAFRDRAKRVTVAQLEHETKFFAREPRRVYRFLD